MLDKLAAIAERYHDLEQMMADPEIAADYTKVAEYAQERSEIEPVVNAYRQLVQVEKDLAEAKHTYELTRQDEITLNIDRHQAGLGSASCGPGTRPAYLVQPVETQFSVRLKAISPQDEPPTSLSKQQLERA